MCVSVCVCVFVCVWVKKSLSLVRRQTLNTNLYLSKSLSHEHRSETVFNIKYVNPSKLSGYLALGLTNWTILLYSVKWLVCVDCVWNVMVHAQKPDFVFRRNGRVHLNRLGASVQSTTGSQIVRISGSNAGYTMFRGTVQDYWLPTPFASFPFTSPTVRLRVPSHFSWTLPDTKRVYRAVRTESWTVICRLMLGRNMAHAVTGLLPRRLGFDPRPVPVRYVVDKVTLG